MFEMRDKTCVVTGATTGIGRATAVSLARSGARVIIPCRSRQRAETTAEELKNESQGVVEAGVCDLASLDSVRAFASSLESTPIHVLVNSAGLISPTRRETQDGIELTLGVTYLGAYLLTRLLLPNLISSSPARVVNVAGEFHRKTSLNFDDFQLTKNYSMIRAGATAMLAKVTFSFDLAQRLEGTGVTVNCLHPGAVRSGLLRSLPWYLRMVSALATPFMRTAEKGAETPVYLACSQDVETVTGRYFIDKEPRDAAPQASDQVAQKKLWEVSSKLVSLPVEFKPESC